jgi:hypothetical protein
MGRMWMFSDFPEKAAFADSMEEGPASMKTSSPSAMASAICAKAFLASLAP